MSDNDLDEKRQAFEKAKGRKPPTDDGSAKEAPEQREIKREMPFPQLLQQVMPLVNTLIVSAAKEIDRCDVEFQETELQGLRFDPQTAIARRRAVAVLCQLRNTADAVLEACEDDRLSHLE